MITVIPRSVPRIAARPIGTRSFRTLRRGALRFRPSHLPTTCDSQHYGIRA